MGRPSTPSHTFEEERLSPSTLTVFRCAKCGDRYPFRLLVIQDGQQVCKPNCATKYSAAETQLLRSLADDEAAQLYTSTQNEIAKQYGQAWDSSLMTGISTITGISSPGVVYPAVASLTVGGAGVLFTMTGIGFVAADTITFSDANITASAQVIATDQLSFTTTVTAAVGTMKGFADMFFNGTLWRKVVIAR